MKTKQKNSQKTFRDIRTGVEQLADGSTSPFMCTPDAHYNDIHLELATRWVRYSRVSGEWFASVLYSLDERSPHTFPDEVAAINWLLTGNR